MICLELRRVAIRVPIRIELVHIVNDGSTIASSSEPGIDQVVARHRSFPLGSEEWKVRIAVMVNTTPVNEGQQKHL
jgi:hypothetical protein